MTNKPSAFPPRVWIDLMMYAEGGSKYYAHQRPYGSAPEYLSVTEHEHLASERERRAREEGRAEGMALAYKDCIHMASVRRKSHNNSLVTSLRLKYSAAKEASRAPTTEKGND